MENSTVNINHGRPVYFSYARNSSRRPEWEHISDCVFPLLDALTDNHLEYRVDVRDIGVGDRISKFEEEIGWNSEVVVIIFSDKYFRSLHCMYEFVQIKNALKEYPNKRLICIKSGDFNLSDLNYIRELEHYWGNQKLEYEDIEYHRLRSHTGTEIAARENGFYIEDIRNLYSFFSAINYSNASSIDYESIVGDIVKYYKNTPPAFTPKPKVVKNVPKTDHLVSGAAQPVTTSQPKTQPVITSQPKTQVSTTSQPTPNKFPAVQVVIAAVAFLFLVNVFGLICNSDSDETKNHAKELFDNGKYSECINEFEELANQGDVDSQIYTGLSYQEIGNEEKAFYWMKKAADQDNPDANFYLANYYLDGFGVAKDSKKAFQISQKYAEKGNADCQYLLGQMYYQGLGVREDYRKAVYWLNKAAEQGEENAKESLKKLEENNYHDDYYDYEY